MRRAAGHRASQEDFFLHYASPQSEEGKGGEKREGGKEQGGEKDGVRIMWWKDAGCDGRRERGREEQAAGKPE